jgi:hypothetical protein
MSKHAAEIFRAVINRIDPSGTYFDLVCFAIIEDINCFKSHNPRGNFAEKESTV